MERPYRPRHFRTVPAPSALTDDAAPSGADDGAVTYVAPADAADVPAPAGEAGSVAEAATGADAAEGDTAEDDAWSQEETIDLAAVRARLAAARTQVLAKDAFVEAPAEPAEEVPAPPAAVVVPDVAEAASADELAATVRRRRLDPARVPSVEHDEHSEETAADSDAEAQVGRSAALMSVLVIISRITGFARTWGQAMALGVTVTASCYTVANNLPNQLYELVMGGMLATAFLPVYLSVKERAGRAGSNAYTSNLLSIVVALMGALTLLGIVFAGPVVWTQSFGANADFDFDLATYFFRFFAIEVVLYALSSVISGVLNAERDYLWSNAAPIFNNIVCTASFFLYAAFAESSPSLAILCLAIGNPAGVAVQVLMQLPSLRRHGIRLTPHINLRDPALKETLSIGVPSLVVTICSFVTVSVQTSSALSVTVSGSSIAYYTRIWYTLPYSIFAIPITTAMFTELSNYVSRGDMAATARGVSFGSGKIAFLLIPFALYLMVFSVPLITLMAAGKFTPDQIQLTADYLVVLAASLPMYGVCTYQQKVCSSLRRMNLYMVAIIVGSVLQVAFCLVLTPLFGLMMVPLSSVFFFTVVDIVTFASLRRQLGPMGMRQVVLSALRALVLGAAGAAVGFGILRLLPHLVGPMGDSAFHALVYCAAGGIPAVAVTFGVAMVAGMEEVSTFRNLLARFLPRRAA